jgi:hypothetical protein
MPILILLLVALAAGIPIDLGWLPRAMGLMP